jgi:hypothetical protein
VTLPATIVIQYIVYAGLLCILGACVYLWINRPHRRPHIIPPFTWALHGATYYTLVLTGILPTGHQVTILLSAVLRLHAVLLTAGGMMIFIWRPNGREVVKDVDLNEQ